LPLHYLKLDRSMVEGVDDNPRDLAVLRGILSMARALGLDVVAEGVER
jgi:EAL domain-containing protein (putative c-di-GMP-specific phosphodiesterase class I)